jgi:chromosome segregation ATPase
MEYSNNIPSFNDICGTVTQALAEIILNREAIIAELREENARAQHLLHERTTNYKNRCEEVERLEKIVGEQRQQIRDLEEEVELDTDISQSETRELVRVRAELLIKQRECEELKKQIEGWRAECEVHEKDEKELYNLRNEVRNLRDQVCRVHKELRESQEQHMDSDKQMQSMWFERDDARRQYCELVSNLEGTKVEKIAHFNGWNDLYPSADNTPSLFEQNEVRRTRRSDFTEQQSDSDPVTGVQYGDLN